MKNKLFILIFSFQIALLSTMIYPLIGINIPLFREIIGSLYLTFIPGILLLIILKAKNLNFSEWIFYSVGLSISFLMFIGTFINLIYPIFGISKPISLIPLFITLTITVSILLFAAIFQERNYKNSMYFYMDVVNLNYAQVLLFCLLLFLSIFGTYSLNFYNNNRLIIILIFVISIIPLTISFEKVNPNLYCFAIFVIALSLLFHYSLVSGYINGYDIQLEKYYSSQVIQNSYWNLNGTTSANSLSSIMILAPIYSLITSMDLVWVYKVIYPFLFAFTSIGLYTLYCKQFDPKTAFLSTFFFISVFTFYVLMPQLARQEIAELFFVLLLCLITNNNISPLNKSIISVAFIYSLIISHYSMSYIFIFLVSVSWIILYLLNKTNTSISLNFILLSYTAMLMWYIYTSNSSNLHSIFTLFENIYSNFHEFFNPNYVQGLDVVMSKVNLTREITKWLHIISQILITVGVITIFVNRKSLVMNTIYKVFLVISYFLCIAGIAVPYVSNALNTMRFYHINLIILSPLFVIGGITLLSKIASTLNLNIKKEKYYIILSVFLTTFLIFNSGIVYEITHEDPNYISFNNSIDGPRFTELEVSSANWLITNNATNNSAYADNFRGVLLLGFYGELNSFSERGGSFYFGVNEKAVKIIPKNSYIFLGEKNINGEIVVDTYGQGNGTRYLKSSPLQKTLLNSNEIYNAGKSIIYFANCT